MTKENKKSKIKKIVLVLVAVACVVILFLEVYGQILTKKDREMYEIIANTEWERVTDSCSEILKIENGGFAYYESCGSPVSYDSFDSDLFFFSDYRRNGNIRIMGIGGVKKIEVVSVDEKCLKIKFDGEVKEFGISREQLRETGIDWREDEYWKQIVDEY